MKTKYVVFVDAGYHNDSFDRYHEFEVEDEDEDFSQINSHNYVENYIRNQLKPLFDALNPDKIDLHWSRTMFVWSLELWINHTNKHGYEEEFFHILTAYVTHRDNLIHYSDSFEFLHEQFRWFRTLYELYKNSKSDNDNPTILGFDKDKILETLRTNDK